MDTPIINTISLCAGIGMLDEAFRLGCEHLGLRARTALCCEWESYAAACLLARMEEQSMEPAPIWCGDLRQLDCRPFRGSVDAIIAGLPCQPYSCAGKQKGLADERSYGDGDGPIPNFLRIVAECQPALVFCENVPPWVRGGWFRPVGEELSGMGYTLAEPLFVTAESVGASHRRERVFVLAYRTGGRLGRLWQSSRGNGFTDGSNEELADSRRKRRSKRSRSQGNGPAESERRNIAITRDPDGRIFAPGPGADWASIPEHLWPAIEPGVRVLVDGVAVVLDQSQTDQLRCGGNGVVPLAAAVAFVELMRREKLV